MFEYLHGKVLIQRGEAITRVTLWGQFGVRVKSRNCGLNCLGSNLNSILC